MLYGGSYEKMICKHSPAFTFGAVTDGKTFAIQRHHCNGPERRYNQAALASGPISALDSNAPLRPSARAHVRARRSVSNSNGAGMGRGGGGGRRTLSFASLSQPAAISAATTSDLPSSAAQWSAVPPFCAAKEGAEE